MEEVSDPASLKRKSSEISEESLSENSNSETNSPLKENSSSKQKKRRDQVTKACSLCRKHKIKCDKELPCRNCIKRAVNCIVEPRKQRVPKTRPIKNFSLKNKVSTEENRTKKTKTTTHNNSNVTSNDRTNNNNNNLHASETTLTKSLPPIEISTPKIIQSILNQDWKELDPRAMAFIDQLQR